MGLAYSQTGKVGINTNNPEATLDIKPNAANSAVGATTNEGMLVPRLSKARLNSIAAANLKESTLVYVSDFSGVTISTTTDVTSKGFYYSNNKKELLKIRVLFLIYCFLIFLLIL